jgi:hypothetical protein
MVFIGAGVGVGVGVGDGVVPEPELPPHAIVAAANAAAARNPQAVLWVISKTSV